MLEKYAIVPFMAQEERLPWVYEKVVGNQATRHGCSSQNSS